MIEQYSEEWFTQRLGKITSSGLSALMTEPKSKSDLLSEGAKTYLKTKLTEKLTGSRKEFQSEATSHGLMLENEALSYYSFITGNKVGECGYMEKITGVYGGTPDGFVNQDGIVQIKCPFNFLNHVENGLIKDIETFKRKHKDYYWQCQSDILVSGRDFCDFASYCRDMPGDLRMFIFRIEPNLDDMALMLEKIEIGVNYMTKIEEELRCRR